MPKLWVRTTMVVLLQLQKYFELYCSNNGDENCFYIEGNTKEDIWTEYYTYTNERL